MSVQAMTWALEEAPDVPPHLVAALIGLANHAAHDGRGAYPSWATLARYTRKSERSVARDLEALESIGLIRRGDQRYTAHLPADRRPVVWDLAMERRRAPAPAEGARGRPKQRGDVGVTPEAENGVTSVSKRGDVGVKTGVTPTSPEPSLRTVQEPASPTPPRQAAGAAAGAAGSGRQASETPEQEGEVSSPPDQEVTAAALVDGLPWPAGQAPDPDTRDRLIGAAAACLTAGHPQATVTSTAADGIPGARRPAAVVLHRLRRLATQPPDRAAAEREQAEQDRREAARTPHPYSEGPRTGYCDRCGHHETHRVHRSATPATAGSACPATTTVERCAEHSRRVCLPCHHHGRDQDDDSDREPTPTGSRPRTAPRQRPADDTSAMTTLGALLESWRQPATV